MNKHKPEKPVIFLAFANDQGSGNSYLRNLSQELREIRVALNMAVQLGLCELIERSNTTIEDIIDVFNDFKNRIAVFHFAGHATSYSLLLESARSGNKPAYKKGLAQFLARQTGLELVFLNGCSTSSHATELNQVGIPVVIGTSNYIADHAAMMLAARFYKSLGNGQSVKTAWSNALDELAMKNPDSRYRGIKIKKNEAGNKDPLWKLYVKSGKEESLEWNLPEAAGDLLFGLPQLPGDIKLPNQPYLFFNRYERKHARLFFGRSKTIRDLFFRITDRNTSPVILFYGQSGAGKSSLLEAGLLPRIEALHTTFYIRREGSKPLSDLLTDLLSKTNESFQQVNDSGQLPLNELITFIDHKLQEIKDVKLPDAEFIKQTYEAVKKLGNKSLEEIARKEYLENELDNISKKSLNNLSENSLLYKWINIEQFTNKPLTIILDQVESLFVEDNNIIELELNEFFSHLDELFNQTDLTPKGKLILSFRKEYLPEIDALCSTFQLPRGKVFLETLKKPQIEEIVMGLTSREDLIQQYNLKIQNALPSRISNYLFDGSYSTIAPVLQIVLTKLWNNATKINAESPVFNLNLFDKLEREGLLLQDFFNQQLEKFRVHFPHEVNSGLILDLLYFLTSHLNSSNRYSLEKICTYYNIPKPKLENLIQTGTDLYLFSFVKNKIGLSHDTLAPLVKMAYQESDLPAQRARRILESYMQNIKADAGIIPLSKENYGEVLKGVNSMRALTSREKDLLAISKKNIIAQNRTNRIIRLIIAILGMTSIGAGITASVLNKRVFTSENILQNVKDSLEIRKNELTNIEKQLSNLQFEFEEKTVELTQKEDTIDNLISLEALQRRKIDANQLITESKSLNGLTAYYKVREAWKIFPNDNARSALIQIIQQSPLPVVVNNAQFPNPPLEKLGAYRLQIADFSKIVCLDIHDNIVLETETNKDIRFVSFSEDGTSILTQFYDPLLPILKWPLLQGQVFSLGHKNPVLQILWPENSNKIFTIDQNNSLFLWDQQNNMLIKEIPNQEINSIDYSTDNNIITTNGFGIPTIRDAYGSVLYSLDHPALNGDNHLAKFSNSQKWILITQEKLAFLWDVGNKLLAITLSGHADDVTHADISDNEQYFATSSKDKTAKVWSASGEILVSLAHDAEVASVDFSPDGKLLLTASFNGIAQIWDWKRENVLYSLRHSDLVNAAYFSPSGKWIVSASNDRYAKLWTANGKLISSFKMPDLVQEAIFSPDEKYLLVALNNGQVKKLLINPNDIIKLIDESYN